MNPPIGAGVHPGGLNPAEFRYDVLVGSDWRHKLENRDRGDLQYLLESALDETRTNLVDSIHTAIRQDSVSGFWLEIPVILARRAHRYARILEVLS